MLEFQKIQKIHNENISEHLDRISCPGEVTAMTPSQASLCRGGEESQEGAGIPSPDFLWLGEARFGQTCDARAVFNRGCRSLGRHTGDERLAVFM